jgi:hypothetical protein
MQQHRPIIEGWDVSGQDTGIIEETFPAVLGEPVGDVFSQRADDMRDRSFWENAGKESGLRQVSEMNKRIAQMVTTTGSLFYRTDAASGYDAIAEAQAMMNERQGSADMRYMVLNDRDQKRYGSDLAGRQTLQGRPENTWKTGQIGSNVAEFDLFTGSFLPNLVGGANPATTTTADVSEKPEAGTVAGLIVTNIDGRLGTIPVTASASYNIGDKLSFSNSGTAVQSVGLMDKTETGEAMTFTIVAIPDGTTIQVFPKPIALDDPALSTLEASYANINTQILDTATVDRLNIDASAKVNAFWSKDSIEVLGGDAPLSLLSEFGGMKVIDSTMSNGQKMYMAYDGNIDTLSFKCRLFTWYTPINKNPMANGVFTTF